MTRVNQDANVGRIYLRLDIPGACSPAFETTLRPDADVASYVDRLNADLREVLKSYLRTDKWVYGEPFKLSVLSSKVIKPAGERDAEHDALLADLRESFAESNDARKAALAADPNNGKPGWWHVTGIRHGALVRATSATEAVQKAADVVNSWESPVADFVGAELPDVFET